MIAPAPEFVGSCLRAFEASYPITLADGDNSAKADRVLDSAPPTLTFGAMNNIGRWNGALGLIAMAFVACAETPDDVAVDEETTLAQEALGHDRHGRGPRLRAPLSATISTSRRPLLRWFGARGDTVQIEICRDRDCDHHIVTFSADGNSARPRSLHLRMVRLDRG